MNSIQMVVLFLGTIALFTILAKFRKRYIIFSRGRMTVVNFSSKSARKSRNVFKIILGLVLTGSYKNISPETPQEELKKMMIIRETMLHGLYCLAVVGLSAIAFLVFAN